jgi:hypothetical protein
VDRARFPRFIRRPGNGTFPPPVQSSRDVAQNHRKKARDPLSHRQIATLSTTRKHCKLNRRELPRSQACDRGTALNSDSSTFHRCWAILNAEICSSSKDSDRESTQRAELKGVGPASVENSANYSRHPHITTSRREMKDRNQHKGPCDREIRPSKSPHVQRLFLVTSLDQAIISADSVKRRVQESECSPFMLDIANPKERIGLRTASETTRSIGLRRPIERCPKSWQHPQNFAQ